MSNILEKKKLEEAEEHVRLESLIFYYFLIINNYFLKLKIRKIIIIFEKRFEFLPQTLIFQFL